ncbi:hypothetical protein [Aureivirga sp. CE67]|uniref:hypothetical protein n=1 Tax=Aureivirga sp. CE67 TaxID=1788983 RepID=UPI0018C9CAA4|nr:hypothetical protein [Aureivirga sp. CE67]
MNKVITSLCSKLDIPDLRAGHLTIRNEKNWRTNEMYIDYSWLVKITLSLNECWIFSVKFNKTEFREFQNPEKLIQGLFTIDKQGEIDEFYKITKTDNFEDKVRNLKYYDLFDANPGITLDGVAYEYFVFARNTELRFSLNNPNSESWKIWEKEIWTIGGELAKKSEIECFKKMFE